MNISELQQLGAAALQVVALGIMYLIVKLVLATLAQTFGVRLAAQTRAIDTTSDIAQGQRQFYSSEVQDLKAELSKVRDEARSEITSLRAQVLLLQAEQVKDKARIAD